MDSLRSDSLRSFYETASCNCGMSNCKHFLFVTMTLYYMPIRKRLISFNIQSYNLPRSLDSSRNKPNANKFNVGEIFQRVRPIKIPGRQLKGKLMVP